jgi:hypothetical protein
MFLAQTAQGCPPMLIQHSAHHGGALGWTAFRLSSILHPQGLHPQSHPPTLHPEYIILWLRPSGVEGPSPPLLLYSLKHQSGVRGFPQSLGIQGEPELGWQSRNCLLCCSHSQTTLFSLSSWQPGSGVTYPRSHTQDGSPDPSRRSLCFWQPKPAPQQWD